MRNKSFTQSLEVSKEAKLCGLCLLVSLHEIVLLHKAPNVQVSDTSTKSVQASQKPHRIPATDYPKNH
jgi:hypothetical protein